MNRIKQKVWPRLIVEGAVIVGSILLAFSLDALWDDREERARERSTLESLRDEFQENRTRLDSTRARHVELREDALRLLKVIALQGEPAGSYAIPDHLVNQIAVTETLDPVRGSLSAVLSAGDLLLIQDDSLRAALAGWPDDLQDLLDFEREDREWNLDVVIPILHDYIPYATIDYRTGRPGFEQPSRFESDHRSLMASLPFENWVDFRVVRLEKTLSEYDIRIAQVEAILARISRALN